ncbi:hypothetical protein L603_000900000030 [Cellulosimicrobium cellulans J34]|nr:hypothetical protein L603_000900000030 [Cellulosimicrobium cellulans J34]SMF18462.1 hypothetical protein SAMN02744115_01868 [Cellulosimicrobium cellulans J1]
MLQIAAGRYFRPGVALNEHLHRRTLHSNAWFADEGPFELPVGKLTGGTERDEVSTAFVEAVDKLEAVRPDGSNDFMIATGGNELIDDIAYVLTFALNATFSRDGDAVRRLVPHEGTTGQRRSGAALFPRLFDPRLAVQPQEMQRAREFMSDLLQLGREDFARVMRVIRRTVDATRRATDDPTGAYTDLIAALESLGDKALARPTTWERYDPKKRKRLDPVLGKLEPAVADEMRDALLDADQAGAARQFVASTLARISPEYYRMEATGARRPPRSADVEEMLRVGYNIRSRRSHALEDLGQEAWVFSEGAEVAYASGFDRIFTLAGLWRLVRHVVRQYVATAPKVADEAWDYRMALPGIITAQLAPHLWVGKNLDASHALDRLNGVADALIAWQAGRRSVDMGFDLAQVAATIEQVVPGMPDSDAKAALVAIHRLWHEWTAPETHTPEGIAFAQTHALLLGEPSPIAYTVGVLSNFAPRDWMTQEWMDMAAARRAARFTGKEAPLPAKIDALIQLEAADRLEADGRHADAILCASNAVEEVPGDEMLLAWEQRLLAGDHDPAFDVHRFLFGLPGSDPEPGEE